MKIKYSKIHNPKTWGVEGFECATPEDAEKALKIISNIIAHYEIERAMQWCEEYLREREVETHHFNNDDCKELFDSSFDLYFDTCVRYLQKVELGL